jgi:hypothetical protein
MMLPCPLQSNKAKSVRRRTARAAKQAALLMVQQSPGQPQADSPPCQPGDSGQLEVRFGFCAAPALPGTECLFQGAKL